MLGNCPISLIDLCYNLTYQFKQFEDATVIQILESFTFGMLANSIKFRDIFMKINQYSVANTGASDQFNPTLVE